MSHVSFSRDHRKGFTLIELLIVVTIIGILASVGLVSYRGISMSARDNKRQADLSTLRQSLTLYRSDMMEYPSGGYDAMITALISGTQSYISHPLPADPRGGSYVYSTNAAQTIFCLCATLEDPADSNASGLGADGVCTFSAGGGSYCVNNP